MRATSQAKGKHAELLIFGKLIGEGVSLYTPIVDWEGIDAIARKKDRTCLEIQVKARKSGCFEVWDLDRLQPEEKLFIVCADMQKEESEGKPEFWVFPAEVFKNYAIEIKSKEGYRCYRLDLNAGSKRHGNRLRREILKDNFEAWHLLRD